MKSRTDNFKLIAGIGNNDTKYENTYHNVGFIMIDYLKKNYPDLKNRLFKNSGYMNESGMEISKAAKKIGVLPEKILLIYDDSDIKIGSYKISFNRNSGGHKGAENTIKSLKTKNFWRLRIGIRPEEEKTRKKAGDFVLKKIKRVDTMILQSVFKKSSEELFDEQL